MEREGLAFLRGAEAIPLVMTFWGLWLFPFGRLVMRRRESRGDHRPTGRQSGERGRSMIA